MNSLNDLKKFSDSLHNQEHQMPLLFVGHGNPMNAIEENEFGSGWKTAKDQIATPDAILCISAHWETNGTFVTAMERPKTIHDFYGFPNELFEVEYLAPGDPKLAAETKSLITKTNVELDNQWGLDHGTWSVLKHMYPRADVPVIQLSIDHNKSPQWHYELAKELLSLRQKGVLIIGSGNMVHNLHLADWHNPNGAYDWACEINLQFKNLISDGNHKALTGYQSLGQSAKLAVPTSEHYIPLIYILGLKEENESIEFFNDKIVMGSLSMTSLKISRF